MPATVLAIDHRWKLHPAAAARPGGFFATQAVASLDAGRLVEDPTLSLYCLDTFDRTGIFVRTPAQVNLSQAAFLYQVQFVEATEVVSLPFNELHEPRIGRPYPLNGSSWSNRRGGAGQPSASLALAAGEGVVALSEPDVYFQVQQLRDRGDPEADELLASCTALLFAPRTAKTCVINFRSQNIELAERA